MQVAVGELAGGLHPAEEVEVEVVAAGAALQDERKDSDERDEGEHKVRTSVARHDLRVAHRGTDLVSVE